MKLRAPIKIAIGFVLLVGISYGGYQSFARWRASSVKLPGILPGRINMVAVNPEAGYRIIVANQVAQLVPDSGEDERTESGREDAPDPSKPRIPMKELLKSLEGDEDALGRLVMVMNGMKEEALPAIQRRWSAEDLRQAIAGEEKLRRQLESDLNVRMDGTPLPTVSLQSIENGIVVEGPVPIEVNVGAARRTLTGTVLLNFRPDIAEKVSDRIAESGPGVDRNRIAGYYREAVMQQGDSKQDIAADLSRLIDSRLLVQRYGEKPSQLLAHANVVVNESQIVSASFSTQTAANHKSLSTIRIELTEEGRDRLLKWSVEHPGFQLLFIVDGVAIAAPRIRHEVWTRQIDINQLPDKNLVKDAVDKMNQLARGGTH